MIEDASIDVRGAADCHVGLYAIGGSGPNRLELSQTDIIGYGGAGNGSASAEFVGAYVVGMDDVSIFASSVAAIQRNSWGPRLAASRMHGAYVVAARSVVASRSSFSTASGGSQPILGVAQLSGATFEAAESIVLDNSVFRAAEGSQTGTGLNAGSTAGLVTITLMNNTSVFGHTFSTPNSLTDAGELASAVRLFGHVRRIDMQNNLWVFARPGNWGSLEAVVDLHDLEVRSQESSRFVANIFSYPGPDNVPGTRGGAKGEQSKNRTMQRSPPESWAHDLFQAATTQRLG